MTAHPTQFYTPAVLDIMSDLRSLIVDNKIDDIDITLQQLGLTSLINTQKPTPLDEAKNIIYILRHVYYDAMGDLYAYIKENIDDEEFENHNIMKLGFWPGGDRDGNPFVTAETTKNVADELRVTLMKCYYNDLKSLQKKLTFKKIQGQIKSLRNNLYVAMFDPNKYIEYKDIIDPLMGIRNLLIDDYHGLYLHEFDHFIDKVKIFKTHFATLDIRQDHSKHALIVETILKKNGLIEDSIAELSESNLVKLLVGEKLKLDPDDYDDIVRDTIVNVAQLKEIQAKNGEEGCNRYIISNSEDIFSVLFVYGLFRWCGWEDNEITFDIVPLFETMKGMDHAEAIMQFLFDLPEYRKHLEQRNDRQTMMLGFSDGTKDGGYLKANWSILKTKEQLSKVCKKNHIKAMFFDGRGGPPARGGGKTHRFLCCPDQRLLPITKYN